MLRARTLLTRGSTRWLAAPASAASARRSLSSLNAPAREPATEAAFPAFTGETRLFINNEFVDAADGATFATINPANGEKLADVAYAGDADVDAAVLAAKAAFYDGPWGTTMTPRDRAKCLFKLAELIEANQEELAVIEALDNGKTISNARMIDAPASANILRYYAGWADKFVGKTIPIGPDHQCYTRHEAVGVCSQIVPWNLPLIGVAAKFGPALTTGNTVVLKTAENTPLSA
jgi:acyl-CoA reductase-like NAD-dependent aldehyde dehydrogenase